MNIRWIVSAAVLAVLVGAGAITYPAWRHWLPGDANNAPAKSGGGSQAHRLVLSKQAQANLGLLAEEEPLATTIWWRTISIPATVVERPGRSDRGFAAPAAGIITHIYAIPGATVRPGDPLFELRLVSEALQTGQTELYRAVQELEINRKQRARLDDGFKAGAVPEAKILDLEFQKERLTVARNAVERDLLARGLTSEQLQQVREGQFLTTIVLKARPPSPVSRSGGAESPSAADGKPLYEVQELKVYLGEHVLAGQSLCNLAQHERLYIEGHAFKEEGDLVAEAARKGWLLEADFATSAGDFWSPFQQPLKIEFIGNTTDPGGLTIPFYVPLVNEARYLRDDKSQWVWRYRPGQRLRLRVPVARVDNVFVLPAEAVVREGPEAYVFVHNGKALDRTAVHVRYEEGGQVVIANDGSLASGEHVVRRAAAALNRALAASRGGEAEHGHDHHHHHEH